MTHEEIAPASEGAPPASTPASGDRRTQVITWFLGATLILLVLAYGGIGALSAYRPPQESAYTIITAALKDIKEILLIVVGVLGGVMTQKHA